MSSSSQSKKSNRILAFFVVLAIIVVCGGYYYQQQHAIPIEETQSEMSAADSLNRRNQEAGEQFLAAKAKESEVQSLGAGLLYKVIKSGAGASPTAESTVKVHYEGRLIDGTIFDSSYQRGEPAEFPVGGVVSGWQIALKAMKPGDIWEVYIPHFMGYGEQGSGASIPPFSALVFKIELLEVK